MVVPKPNPTKDKLLKLMSEKVKLEATINQYGAVLEANDNVGLHGPLIDGEGFPRNDIDVHQVRQARQQIICLQNDHKELMKQIETLLHQLHAEQKQQAALETQQTPLETQQTPTPGMQTDADEAAEAVTASTNASSSAVELQSPLTVIVVVNLVSADSPAEEAGLRVGDEILQFGTINSRNFANDLNQIGSVVRHMQNQRVALKVQRELQVLDMILIPKVWSGRGFLGCNIVLPPNGAVEP